MRKNCPSDQEKLLKFEAEGWEFIKRDLKFWAAFGSRGCREKKLPAAISKELIEVVF